MYPRQAQRLSQVDRRNSPKLPPQQGVLTILPPPVFDHVFDTRPSHATGFTRSAASALLCGLADGAEPAASSAQKYPRPLRPSTSPSAMRRGVASDGPRGEGGAVGVLRCLPTTPWLCRPGPAWLGSQTSPHPATGSRRRDRAGSIVPCAPESAPQRRTPSTLETRVATALGPVQPGSAASGGPFSRLGTWRRSPYPHRSVATYLPRLVTKN